jgi:hypothetical protein
MAPPTLQSLQESAESVRKLIANGYKELAEAEAYLRSVEAQIATMEAEQLGKGVQP